MDELQELPGVGDSTAGKLHQAGYDTYEQIASAMVGELSEKTGLSERAAERIIQSAQEIVQKLQTRESEMQSAQEIIQELQEIETLEVEQPPESELEEPMEEVPEVLEEPLQEVIEDEILVEVEPVEQLEEEITTEEVTEVSEEVMLETEEPTKETPEMSEEPPPETAAVDLYGVTDRIVEEILQEPKVMEKLAKDIASEFADIIKKEMRGKLIEQALSQPNFRKMLISRIVKKLS